MQVTGIFELPVLSLEIQNQYFLTRETDILSMLLERPSFVHQKYCQTFCHKFMVRVWQCVKIASSRNCLPLN